MKRKLSSYRGMTILEVLVALAVFSMVSVALLSSMNNQVFGLQLLENKTFATFVADNQLTELKMRSVLPSKSWVTGEEKLADRTWYYRYQAIETGDDALMAIDMQVHETKKYDDPIVTIRTYVYTKQ
ncbi:MAG: type II secretion system minor pseudopilin GspI [Succinivibrionaceae bacterium]|nr:type II secretion system minor pseudopilin GspI [Succinivibrionaceae bacterium]